MIKQIKLKIVIEDENGEITKHNWSISGFMHRKLKLIHNNKIDLRTATQIRDWFMKILQGVM